jgi:hypothetical protein
MEDAEHPALKQLQEVSSEVNMSWAEVVEFIRAATLELVDDLSEEEIEGLYSRFWETHSGLVGSGRLNEKILAEILTRAEQLQKTQHKTELQEVQREKTFRKFLKILPTVKDW